MYLGFIWALKDIFGGSLDDRGIVERDGIEPSSPCLQCVIDPLCSVRELREEKLNPNRPSCLCSEGSSGGVGFRV